MHKKKFKLVMFLALSFTLATLASGVDITEIIPDSVTEHLLNKNIENPKKIDLQEKQICDALDNSKCKTTVYIISINKQFTTQKKQIDFSDWGPCIHEESNGCIIVTCVSRYDGAHNGQFTDCRGGKTCQRFEFCQDKVRVLYKNSRDDFVENDPTFFNKKLELREADS